MKGSGTDARRTGRGAIAGLLAAATALGVGQLVAGLTGASGSPVVAVGELQIDFTPPWLKNFAIANFGSDDKLILVGGILVVIALFAALIGMEATRRLWVGMAGLAVFAAIGVTAAATRPTASFASLLPTVAATAAAAAVLRILIPLAGPPARHRPATWTADPWQDTWAAAPDAEVTAAEPAPGELEPGEPESEEPESEEPEPGEPESEPAGRSPKSRSPASCSQKSWRMTSWRMTSWRMTVRAAGAFLPPARRRWASRPRPGWPAGCWPSGAASRAPSGHCASPSPR